MGTFLIPQVLSLLGLTLLLISCSNGYPVKKDRISQFGQVPDKLNGTDWPSLTFSEYNKSISNGPVSFDGGIRGMNARDNNNNIFTPSPITADTDKGISFNKEPNTQQMMDIMHGDIGDRDSEEEEIKQSATTRNPLLRTIVANIAPNQCESGMTFSTRRGRCITVARKLGNAIG